MKKLLFILIAISTIQLLKGQTERLFDSSSIYFQDNNSIGKHLTKLYHPSHQLQIKSNKNGSKALEWKLDTLITFACNGDNNPKENIMVIFYYDIDGNVSSRVTKNWKDSTWINVEKNTYTYNSHGLLVIELSEIWNGVSWENWRKELMGYNKNFKLITKLSKRWESSSWRNIGKLTCNYDLNGNLLSEIMEGRVQFWELNYRNLYTYDSIGNMLSYQHEYWTSGNLVYADRRSITYDVNSKITSQISQNYEANNNWKNYSRDSFIYDQNSNLVIKINESWNGSAWTKNKKNTYTYNSKGNQLTNLIQEWNGTLWRNAERNIFAYNLSGKMEYSLIQVWKNNNWLNIERYTFYYNIDGGLLRRLHEFWVNGIFVNSSRLIYDYDIFGNAIKGNCELYYNGIWKNGNSLDFEIYFEHSNSLLKINEHISYYIAKWSLHNTVGISSTEQSNSSLVIYPNPASTQLTIEADFAKEGQLFIFNANGQEVFRQQLVNQKSQIDISNLSIGVYFLKVVSDKGVEVKKFVKQ